MNVEMVMKAVVKVAEDLTRLRLVDDSAPKEPNPPEIDTNEDKEYEDDEDDDFDDADEEVGSPQQLEAAENDDKYRFSSPLDQYCPLLYLQSILAGLEKANPDYFKFVMSTLSPDQTNLLLQCINSSQEYVHKLKEALDNKHPPPQASANP